jgi:hypothetical protein
VNCLSIAFALLICYNTIQLLLLLRLLLLQRALWPPQQCRTASAEVGPPTCVCHHANMMLKQLTAITLANGLATAVPHLGLPHILLGKQMQHSAADAAARQQQQAVRQ